MQEGQLNFDAAQGMVEKLEIPQVSQFMSESIAEKVSVAISLLAFSAVLWLVVYSLKVSKKYIFECKKSVPIPFQILSILVSTFLLFNLGFGGAAAFLLGRTTEDSKDYFSEITALKLAKLSHEHFFGYAVSFGIIAILSLFFLSYNKKRVLVPVYLMFVFSALDVASWWLSRFVSFGFHILTYISGGAITIGFIACYMQIVHFNIKSIRNLSKEQTK